MPKGKSSRIEADLRLRLEQGEWTADERLPDERSLATHYAVARNTVRRAFTTLEDEGLIMRQVGRGTIVRGKPDPHASGILKRFQGASPLDILNLRLFIEPHAAAAAARNASESDLRSIQQAKAMAEQHTVLETYEYWDNEFHRRISLASGNKFISEFFSLMTIIRYAAPMMEIRKLWFTEDRRKAYCDDHDGIMSALENWDSEAAKTAMRDHLLARRKNYFGQ
ncbi:FCD domain-containing protein [Hoeflea sp. AS60]|uniref:FadR/GntR family transcriptional regulator n=1 Tax=Hoeflea sp. AS60 TaxID=3135780 RepID=UPI00317229C3